MTRGESPSYPFRGLLENLDNGDMGLPRLFLYDNGMLLLIFIRILQLQVSQALD